jgi:predicted DCC family thiol-disulfide oxidoreductase YuxK
VRDETIPGLVRHDRGEPLPTSALVIFDGTCGFCTWSVAVLDRRLGVRVQAIPYQWLDDAELAAIGTSRARCADAVHFIDAHGHLSAGADAINALLRDRPLVGPVVRLVARVPLLVSLERRAYVWVTKHRERISQLLGTRRYALITGDDGAS